MKICGFLALGYFDLIGKAYYGKALYAANQILILHRMGGTSLMKTVCEASLLPLLVFCH
jgi:hypothetical protein